MDESATTRTESRITPKMPQIWLIFRMNNLLSGNFFLDRNSQRAKMKAVTFVVQSRSGERIQFKRSPWRFSNTSFLSEEAECLAVLEATPVG
jgi:hypothetical protein